jgi:hypothetical protein
MNTYALPLFLILYTVAMLLAGTDDFENAKQMERYSEVVRNEH